MVAYPDDESRVPEWYVAVIDGVVARRHGQK
jgi:hypothetical protein